ncbi:MAG: hypothetical protein QNL62_14625 [Gammaproteobacteria bacterium]|nr:hypothetical protein [Gammaproteobacteria bacterium]
MKAQANDYELISALFIRLLSLIFLSAFISLSGQIEGMAASLGILPVSFVLDARLERWGNPAWRHFPSLLWLNTSDSALIGAAYAGCITSLLLFFNIFPRLSLSVILLKSVIFSIKGSFVLLFFSAKKLYLVKPFFILGFDLSCNFKYL